MNLKIPDYYVWIYILFEWPFKKFAFIISDLRKWSKSVYLSIYEM